MSKAHLGLYTIEKNFYVVEFGKSDEGDLNTWGPGIRDRYILHFCLSGEGTFNGNKVTDKNYFLITPFTKINYAPNPNNKWQYFWIIMGGSRCKSALKRYGFRTTTGVGEYDYKEKLLPLLESAFPEVFEPLGEDALNYCFKMILSFNRASGKSNDNGDAKKKHFNDAVHFINLKYHSGITPTSVAKYVKLEEKYLCALFKEFCNISTQQYINNVRVQKSKQLLSQTDLSISEVAYSVGINDSLYFSRFFKKHVGVSPKAFRLNKDKHT